jgi:hypothetical protein
MSPTSIVELLQAIEARLSTIPGLRVSDVVPDAINPPQAIIGVPEITSYRETMGRARWVLTPTVTVLVSKAGPGRSGQLKLAAYASTTGPDSIPAAIESDQTLGGFAEAAIVESFRPLGMEEVGIIGYDGGVFGLKVVIPGK